MPIIYKEALEKAAFARGGPPVQFTVFVFRRFNPPSLSPGVFALIIGEALPFNPPSSSSGWPSLSLGWPSLPIIYKEALEKVQSRTVRPLFIGSSASPPLSPIIGGSKRRGPYYSNGPPTIRQGVAVLCSSCRGSSRPATLFG